MTKKPINVTYKNSYNFKRGLIEGALNNYLNPERTGKTASLNYGIYGNQLKAFVTGYNLAKNNDYSEEYKKSTCLMLFAFLRGDIKKNFKIVRTAKVDIIYEEFVEKY